MFFCQWTIDNKLKCHKVIKSKNLLYFGNEQYHRYFSHQACIMRCKSPRTYHICLFTSYVRVLDRIIFMHLFIYVIVGCIDFILIILKVASNNDNKFDKKGSRAARDYQQEDITRYRYCYKNGKSLIFKSWINRYIQPIFFVAAVKQF